MNWFLRGALGLVLAASAGVALAQPYGPPLAGAAPAHMHDDSPPPPRDCGYRDRCGFDPYGFDRSGHTRDGYDLYGYDPDGFDRYGFDQRGYTRDGYDRFGYDQRGYDRYGRAAAKHQGQVDSERFRADRSDRYERPARPYHGEVEQDRHQSERFGRYDEASPDRYGSRGDDWDAPADGYYVPTHGGAQQHFADPRCSTCRPRDCGCDGLGYSSVRIGPAFFYDNGGVGPIPDGGGYGGGGYVIMGGGFAGARSSASASASAYASSSSRVSVGVRTGGHGGCKSCGGHR